MAADRGRDVVLRVVSDESKFDLSGVAAELDDVATESADANRDLEKTTDELKRLASQGKDAQRQLDALNAEVNKNKFDELGKDAKAAADKVDRAFDAMGKSAHDGMAKVDHEAHEGLGEFKDEAASTGREAAASFSGGFEDVTDTIQEVAANAFAGFGPLGAAAGLAAAAGIGLLTKGLQDAADQANALKDRVIDLAGAITDAGGNLNKVDFAGRMKDWSAEIADNKHWWELWQKDNVTNLEKVSDAAKLTGLGIDTLFSAMSGKDPAAMQRVLSTINKQIADQQTLVDHAAKTGMRGANLELAAQQSRLQALKDVKDQTLTNAGVTEDAINLSKEQQSALASLNAETERAARGDAAHAAAVEQVKAEQDAATQAEADRVAGLSTLQQAIADTGKAEVTRKDGTVKSIDEIIAAQNKEIAAKLAFETNTKKVFAAVGQAGVDWANSFGPLAPQMMAKLAAAPAAKQKEIVAQYTKIGQLAGQSTAAGLVGSKPQVVSAVDNLHASADAELQQLGKLGIKVGVDGATISREAQLAWLELDRWYREHPIKIPVGVNRGLT